MKRLLAVVLSLWFGMHITAGYVVAPVLFAHLPRMTAGYIAGILFNIVSYTGLFVWGLTFLASRKKQELSLLKTNSSKLIGIIWILIAINQWFITPVIEALKTDGKHWLLQNFLHCTGSVSEQTNTCFGIWHGSASIIYLLTSLIGLYLIIKFIRFEWR